jgi:glycosyltransferase involved in cell wall biosynthesis
MDRLGISAALNAALEHATNDLVLVTHDDCRVASDWVRVAHDRLQASPEILFTGRVLPDGTGTGVPSTKTDPLPAEYRGQSRCDVLFPNNMAMSASAAAALGGFDERYTTAAEDNDFCYRWLRAGRTIRYEPDLLVWHSDWRTPADLALLYKRYWRAQGQLYGNYLAQGDMGLVPSLVRNLGSGVIGPLRRRFGRHGRHQAHPDLTYGAVPGLARGLGDALCSRRPERRQRDDVPA